MKQFIRIVSTYVLLATLWVVAGEPTAPKNGSMTNKSDEIINIFLFKSPAGASNILLANGWTQKSLSLLANSTQVAQTFVKEASVVNLGIGFLSDFATDVLSSVMAAISTKGQFLCVTKGAKVRWNSQALRKKIKDPYLESVFCAIFATQPDWTTNFKKIMYMGPIDISTNYEFYAGKMVNTDSDEIVSEFAPIEQIKSGAVKKLTDKSPEEVAKELQGILLARKEREQALLAKEKKAAQIKKDEELAKTLQESLEETKKGAEEIKNLTRSFLMESQLSRGLGESQFGGSSLRESQIGGSGAGTFAKIPTGEESKTDEPME